MTSGWGMSQPIWPRTGVMALVAKQRAGAVAGAVEEDALGECAELGGGVELAGDDFAASEEELFGELVAVGGDVEHELGGAAGEAGGEGMGAGGEVEGAGGDVLDKGHVVGEADGVFGVAAAGGPARRVRRRGGNGR